MKREDERRVKIDLDRITIVLNKPKYPGNIGAAARAAKNMGISNISVVKRGDPDMVEMLSQIRQMATHLASDTVDRIRFHETLGEALSDFTYIAGTTRRLGNARGPVIDPGELAAKLIDLSHNNRVAIIFGPEDFGLTNEELQYCHDFVAIPTSEKFKSINLSHSVMIICYELFKAASAKIDRLTPKLATSSELEGMYDQMQELFIKINFIRPENPDYWMSHVRRFLSRIQLYSKEVRIIRGICRQVLWYSSNKKT